jgi:hypothetical protein
MPTIMNDQMCAFIINQYDFNLSYAKKLVEDLSDEQMTFTPSGGLDNHPAFTLGHLVSGSAMLAEDLGEIFEMPDNWAELFLRKGPGDPRRPDPDRSKYPSKEILLSELQNQHEKVKSILNNIDKNKLNEKLMWRFSKLMPTLFDNVIFMCITHEAMHLGQLAAWRRAMNLSSALGSL